MISLVLWICNAAKMLAAFYLSLNWPVLGIIGTFYAMLMLLFVIWAMAVMLEKPADDKFEISEE